MRPRRRTLWAGAIAALALTGGLGHRWLALGWSAARYPTAAPHARTQVVIADDRAYVAAGVDGIEVVDLANGRVRASIRPAAPADRIDDLAIADGWILALDATPPGHLMSFSLAGLETGAPALDNVPVPVGPFAGVAAATGLAIVSGGTGRLTLRELDRQGRFGGEVASADFGRGQPDAAILPGGRIAAVSTHTVGPDFGLTFVEIRRSPLALEVLSEVPLAGAGFTRGGFKPAHFPLVVAALGHRVIAAHGGGIDVIDVSDPRRPRVTGHDSRALPAIDVVVAADRFEVLRAGHDAAVLQYRLTPAGLPVPTGTWSLPKGSRPASIARVYGDLLITQLDGDWRLMGAQSLADRPRAPLQTMSN